VTVVEARNAVTDAAARPARRLDALVLGVVAAVLVFLGSWIPSIWYDEAATISGATRSWASLGRMIEGVDAVHALFYGILHLWFDLVGYSPVLLRLPSAVFAGLAVALTVVLAGRFGPRWFAVLAGAVLMVVPRFGWAGSEGRSYALTMVLALAMTLAFLAASRLGRPLTSPVRRPESPPARRSGWWWVLYAVVSLLGIALFLYLALVVVAHVATMLVLALARRVDRRTVAGFAIAAVCVAVVSAPFVLVVTSQSNQLSWVDPIDARTLRGVFLTQFFPKNPAFAVAAWTLAAAGTVALVTAAVRARAENRGRAVVLVAVALPWLVVPVLAIVVASVVITPVYSPRYLTFCLPALALVIAAAPMLLPARRRKDGAAVPAVVAALTAPVIAALAIVALLAVLSVPSYLAQRRPEAKQDASWSQAAARVAVLGERLAAEGEHPAVVFGSIAYHPGATARVVEYAYPDAFAGLDDVALVTPYRDSAGLWEIERPVDTALLAGHDSVVLVTSGREREIQETALLEAGFTRADHRHYTNLNVSLYTRP